LEADNSKVLWNYADKLVNPHWQIVSFQTKKTTLIYDVWFLNNMDQAKILPHQLVPPGIGHSGHLPDVGHPQEHGLLPFEQVKKDWYYGQASGKREKTNCLNSGQCDQDQGKVLEGPHEVQAPGGLQVGDP
jgi:hypothetical protein